MLRTTAVFAMACGVALAVPYQVGGPVTGGGGSGGGVGEDTDYAHASITSDDNDIPILTKDEVGAGQYKLAAEVGFDCSVDGMPNTSNYSFKMSLQIKKELVAGFKRMDKTPALLRTLAPDTTQSFTMTASHITNESGAYRAYALVESSRVGADDWDTEAEDMSDAVTIP